MNTFVISNIHVEPMVLSHVQEFKPIVSLTPDFPYPAIGHFRCFHGHTNALRRMTDETALVFEDDCIPDEAKSWRDVIEAANVLAESKQFESVCLHGRGFDFAKFTKFTFMGFDWLKPNTHDRWVLGTLAYVVNRQGAKKFIDADFWLHNWNIDLFFWSYRFDFAMIDPRQFVPIGTPEIRVAERPGPFIHGRGGETSVIEHPRNIQFVSK